MTENQLNSRPTLVEPTWGRLASSPAMDRVDRLGWPVGFAISAYGMRIGVRSNDPEVLPKIRGVLSGKWKSAEVATVDRVYSVVYAGSNGTSARRFNHIYGDETRLARSRDLETVLAAFDSDYRMFLAEFAKKYVFVHAGAVGWKGRAIIFPGRSFSGKSTLVAELVRAGATYYSDEYAVIDSNGRLHPFIKPIELRDKVTHTQSKLDLSELGGRVGTKALPIGIVLIANFKDGSKWRPRRLTSGKGVLQILANTVSARRNPQRALEALERVTANAEVLKGFRGDAAGLVPELLARLESRMDPTAR